MMRECPCSTKIREGLENPSPPPSRFPLAMGFAPLDPRDFPRASPSGNPSGLGVQNPWPREISQDFPRPSRFPSGFALGKSLGSREILGVGERFSNLSLLLVEHGYIVSTVAEPHARDCGNISTDNVVRVDDVVGDIKEFCNFLNCQDGAQVRGRPAV